MLRWLMLGITDYGAFVATVILFLMMPGPGNLALITSTAKSGIRGGIAAILGLILGDQVLLWLAVAGLAAVLRTSPALFGSIQWLGALYLLWLGGRMLLAAPGQSPSLNFRPHHYLRQAMTITVLNPKAILFYMAFFPLFVNPAHHPSHPPGLLTFGLMAITIAVLTFVYGLIAVLICHHLAEHLRNRPTFSRIMTRLGGAALVAFGIKLALGR